VLLLLLLASICSASFDLQLRHQCGACADITRAQAHGDLESCRRFGACHLFNDSTTSCHHVCGHMRAAKPSEAAPSHPDIRVAKGLGSRPYGAMRLSIITQKAQDDSGFDYSERFKYRWTKNFLSTSIVEITPGSAQNITLGNTTIEVTLPAQGAGTSGVLIADPCVVGSSITALVACSYGKKFQTMARIPALLNAFVPQTDFFGILGDNFYDRSGHTTQHIFEQLSVATKSKILLSVAGNHDYWILGSPDVSTKEDQYGYGHMQWYAQDVLAAAEGTVPYNFSINPSSHHIFFGGNLPSISNSFFYNQVGNIAFFGYSGAYSLAETRPYLEEACSWADQQRGVELIFLVGHWDFPVLGCEDEMDVPHLYDEVKQMKGCDSFDQADRLKFVMGHTHCNDPHPHGRTGAGFRVAGQGMEGCANFGVPVVDTTDNHVRLWYFPVVYKNGTDVYDNLMACISAKSWRECTHLAENWLDQRLS